MSLPETEDFFVYHKLRIEAGCYFYYLYFCFNIIKAGPGPHSDYAFFFNM